MDLEAMRAAWEAIRAPVDAHEPTEEIDPTEVITPTDKIDPHASHGPVAPADPVVPAGPAPSAASGPAPSPESGGPDPGRLLRAVRGMRRLSQRELATLARLPHSTVRRIESGETRPRWDTLSALVTAAGYAFVLVDHHGRPLEVDDDRDQLVDASGRHFPAHLRLFRTPPYTSIHYKQWWGWDRIAFMTTPASAVPEWTYRRRRSQEPRADPVPTTEWGFLWDDAT